MASLPVTGVYNDGYIAELFESYRRDEASVGETWRQYFRMAEALGGGDVAAARRPGLATTVLAEPSYLRKVAGAAALIDAIRYYGHLAV